MLNIATTDPATPGELSRDEIVRVLEEEISTAKLRPGERLDERVLAARFGVSRAPVRDAIGRLASLGMIDVRPRSGSYVSVLSASEVFELLEVMSALEATCAYYAAQRLDIDGQTELRRLNEACAKAAEAAVEPYVLGNLAFHDCIYRGTRNSQLERLVRQARQRVRTYRAFTMRFPGRLKQSAQEHQAITDAICRGDGPEAQRLMTDHTIVKPKEIPNFLAIFDTMQAKP